MRRNTVMQLKQKHMQNFQRTIISQMLKEREKLPGYKANQYDTEVPKAAAAKKSHQSSVATHETSQFA